MSDGDGRDDSAFGRLGSGTLVIIIAGVIAFAVWHGGQISARRQVTANPANYPCQKADDCAAQQLQASVQAAAAAQDSVDLGLWQLALNVVGVAGLAYTVHYARKTWLEARDTLRHADDTSKRELRAYLFVTEFIEADFEVGKTPNLKIQFFNRGATPASDALFYNQMDLYPPNVDEKHLVPPERDDVSRAPIPQNDGGSATIYMHRPLTAKLWQAYLDGDAMFIAFGRIDYIDIFDQPHSTYFRYRKRADRSGGHMVIASDGNHYT